MRLSEEEKDDLHRQVDLCDGIILQGGDYSYAYEEEIARYALEKDIPIFGICAGFNNILRALGSNVYEDKRGRHAVYDRNYRHHIRIEKDSKNLGKQIVTPRPCGRPQKSGPSEKKTGRAYTACVKNAGTIPAITRKTFPSQTRRTAPFPASALRAIALAGRPWIVGL